MNLIYQDIVITDTKPEYGPWETENVVDEKIARFLKAAEITFTNSTEDIQVQWKMITIWAAFPITDGKCEGPVIR